VVKQRDWIWLGLVQAVKKSRINVSNRHKDRASRLRSTIALRTSRHLKKIGALKITLLAFADQKILDSRLADDGKTTIQTATKSH
jgi:hypothetical protein